MTTATVTRHLSAAKLAEAAGITYRQFNYWRRSGALPGVARTSGSGQTQAYPSDLVPVVRFLARIGATATEGGQATAPGGIRRVELLRRVGDVLAADPALLDADVLFVSPAGDVTRLAWPDAAYIVHRSHWCDEATA